VIFQVSFLNTGETAWTFYATLSLRRPDGSQVNVLPVTAVQLNPGQQGGSSWGYAMDQAGDWGVGYGIWKDAAQTTALVPTGWFMPFVHVAPRIMITSPTLTAATARLLGSTPGIEIQWTASTGATSYDVYRDGDYLMNVDVPSIWDSGSLMAGQTYTYYVKARNSAGTSTASNSLSCVAPTPPLAPTVPPAPVPSSPGSLSEPGSVIGTLTPTLSWSPSPGATGYALAISVAPYGSAYLVYNPVGLTGTSVSVPPGVLTAGRQYRWNMQACNSAGWSEVSGLLYFQTEP
jgi:hypothetical protein